MIQLPCILFESFQNYHFINVSKASIEDISLKVFGMYFVILISVNRNKRFFAQFHQRKRDKIMRFPKCIKENK
ncbi:MAG: hypothetical protein ACI9YH_002691 [Colwellia sp.]|jgi:hypothetical protein